MPPGSPSVDGAIRRPSEDLLDRGRFADVIAEEVLAAPSDAGFVVGLTGAWGIGKTSVLNFIEASLGDRATVVRFNPWLFSSADELVVRFFAEVADVLAPEQEPAPEDRGRNALKAVASRMAAYGAALAPVAGLLASPLAQVLAVPEALMRAGVENRSPTAGPSAQTSHTALSEALRALDRKLVIFVDDFDRLTPGEIREVVRLVKLVGDLPNVVYVLAYDRPRVERALRDEAEDGRAYLEKIVQSAPAVPPIPATRLRQMCLEGLQDRLGDADLEHFDIDRWSPLANVLLNYVVTLRDSKRYANAAATDLRAVGGEVAAHDVMALAALRVFDPDVHVALPRIASDLTGASRGFDLREESEKRRQIDEALEQSRHPKTSRNLLRTLFPAAPLDSMIYSGGDRDWRARRLVASPSVLS
jgi:predicted KAP-like P-loop ATPase